MSSHNNKRHSVLCSLGLYALCALSLCVLNLSARPAEAAPFAYVANSGSGNNPSNTVTVGSRPADVAVTPDGKHVYVVNSGDNTASVIDAITNEVVDSPIPVGRN